MGELIGAVSAFLNHVVSQIRRRLGTESEKGPGASAVRPVPPALRYWFEDAEVTAPWEELLKACADTFNAEGHRKLSQFFWRDALRHWFRRTGVYLDSLRSTPLDPRVLTERLVADIQRPEENVILLALIEGVRVARTSIDFGNFALVKPHRAELEGLLGVEVNRVFYPHAITSTDRLGDHWYIRALVQQKRHKIGYILLPDEFLSGAVRPRYSHLPPSIENALKRIALWDWHSVFSDTQLDNLVGDDGWEGFDIPFIISISDDPFKRPPGAPPVERLSYEPCFDDEGEEVGETPLPYCFLDGETTSALETFVRSISTQLENVLAIGEPWQFVDHALNYLVKGFFSNGVEQMLWHVISLEALFGEKGPWATERLSKRLATVYSEDKTRSEEARRAFVDLYNLRSDFVHGRAFRAPTHQRHLRIARTLARAAALRMLEILDRLAAALKAGTLTAIPAREEILEVIDLDPESRKRFSQLIAQFL